MSAQTLIDICKGKKNLWIQTHNFPDPDAISSAFGLQELLKHFGIESGICHVGLIDKLSSIMLLELCEIEVSEADDANASMTEGGSIILVDCQKENGNTKDLLGSEIAAVDHHPTVTEITYNYKDVRMVGACASIIASYYQELGVTPSAKAATALLYGMRMDTLDFSRGVTAFDIDMYRFLFDSIDPDLLTDLETNNMEFHDLEAYGSAIENIRAYGKIAFSHLDFACPDALVASLADFILSLAETEVVVIYAKRGDGYKFSFRSERADVNAGDLANECLKDWGNGGGHPGMAGGFVEASVLNNMKGGIYKNVMEHTLSVIQKNWPQIL